MRGDLRRKRDGDGSSRRRDAVREGLWSFLGILLQCYTRKTGGLAFLVGVREP